MTPLKLLSGLPSEAERFNEAKKAWLKIEQMLARIADGVDARGRSGLVATTNRFEISVEQADELHAILREKSKLWGTVKNDPKRGRIIEFYQDAVEKEQKRSLDGDDTVKINIFVKLYRCRGNECWIVDVGRHNEMPNIFSDDVIYCFSAENYASNNSYRGKRFWDIREALASEYGVDSKVIHQIDRVCALCRSVLYGDLSKSAEKTALVELKVLLLSVGQAAHAIVEDFERDHHDNEGWKNIT